MTKKEYKTLRINVLNLCAELESAYDEEDSKILSDAYMYIKETLHALDEYGYRKDYLNFMGEIK